MDGTVEEAKAIQPLASVKVTFSLVSAPQVPFAIRLKTHFLSEFGVHGRPWVGAYPVADGTKPSLQVQIEQSVESSLHSEFAGLNLFCGLAGGVRIWGLENSEMKSFISWESWGP